MRNQNCQRKQLSTFGSHASFFPFGHGNEKICPRWRQIVYASRDLDLALYCSNGMPIRHFRSPWLTIAFCCFTDDVISKLPLELLKPYACPSSSLGRRRSERLRRCRTIIVLTSRLTYLELSDVRIQVHGCVGLPSGSWVDQHHVYDLVCTASPFQNYQHFFCWLVTSFLFILTMCPRLVAFRWR